MAHFEGSAVFWVLAAAQLLGIASACLTRLTEGSVCQAVCQKAFVALLALVGVGTMMSITIGPGQWLLSGATLSVMILTVVWDFSGSRRATIV